MPLTVSLISPEKILFEGEVEGLVAPAFDGEVGILPSHAPMMTLLGTGTLVLGMAGQGKKFAINGGFLQVINDRVRIVTEQATATS